MAADRNHPSARVGLIGLGNMGLPIATNLIGRGRAVLAHDSNPASVARAAAAGADTSPSLRDVAAECPVILLSLPTPTIVRTVALDLISHAPPGRIIVDLSTNDPKTARELGAAAGARGCTYLDAPVSGGPSRARSGELTLMVGGDDNAVREVRPLLSEIARQVEHVGPSGSGVIAKLLNNFIALWTMVGVSQAFLAAVKMDVSLDRLYDVMSKSSARSYSLDRNFPKIRNRDFDPNFLRPWPRKICGWPWIS